MEKTGMQGKVWTVTALGCALAFPVMAAAGEEPAGRTETVVVTASRVAEKIENVTQNVTVIPQEEIAKNQYEDMGQLLRHYGIGVSGYGANQSLSQIAIRGIRTPTMGNAMTSAILMLIDGRRAGTTNVSLLPLAGVERIEIIRGPAAVQYGTSAVGGVVNVITKRGGKELEALAEAGYGSWDTVKTNAGVSGSAGPWDFSGGLAWMTVGDDYRTGSGRRVHNSDSDYRLSYVLNTGVNFLEEQRLGLSFLGVRGESIGSPGSLDWQTPEASTDRDQHSLDLVYDGGYNSAGLKWQLRYFDMNEDYEYKDPPSFVHSRAQTDNQGAQAQLSWNWNILTLTGGVDWLDNDYSPQQDQSRSELENEAAFLMAKVALLEEKIILNGGLRYDDYTLQVEGRDRDLDKTTYSGGLALHALEWLTFRGNYGTAYRVPTGMETLGYHSDWSEYFGDPDLAPEEGHSWDAGFEIDYGAWRLGVSYFQIDYKNKIATRPVEGGYEYYNIGGSSRYRGLESQASVDLGQVFDWQFMLRPYLNMTNMFTYEDAEGRELQYVRDADISYGINFLYPSIGLEADLRFVWLGHQKESSYDPLGNADAEIRTGGDSTVDFFIKKTLLETGEKGRLSIKGEVLNIFDEEYSTIYGYPMPGRSFFVGLRYDF